MSIYYESSGVTLHHGDCLAVLTADTLGYDYRLGYAPPAIPDASIDAVVTDPPYGLEFMGKEWDTFGRDTGNHAHREKPRFTSDHMGKGFDKIPNTYEAGKPFQQWCALWAAECLRVLKPGGHLLAFGGTRTWHRLAVAVEDAGFEIRDSIAWLYGSGFPKSLDVSKAITGAQMGHGSNSGAIRRATMGDDYTASGVRGNRDGVTRRSDTGMAGRTLDLTPDAEQWQGWGTALKPAFEPCVVGRKPLAGTVATNVLAHGAGALNIDGCRLDTISEGPGSTPESSTGGLRTAMAGSMGRGDYDGSKGRWPANVILDIDQAAELDAQSGILTSGKMRAGTRPKGERETYGQDAAAGYETIRDTPGDSGGASRFFYVAKADASERVRVDGVAHPTVKPLALMRWLVRLVTPPGGTVLEPFAGSGTTVEACLLEGFRCVAIEREADYLPLIRQRLDRRLDPVAAVRGAGLEDGGLFDLLDGGAA